MPDTADHAMPGWTRTNTSTIYPTWRKTMSSSASDSLYDPMDVLFSYRLTFTGPQLRQCLGIGKDEFETLAFPAHLSPWHDVYSYREAKAIILANTRTFNAKGDEIPMSLTTLKELAPKYHAAYDPKSKPMPWMHRLFFSARQICDIFTGREEAMNDFLASLLAKFFRVGVKRLYYPSFVHMFF